MADSIPKTLSLLATYAEEVLGRSQSESTFRLLIVFHTDIHIVYTDGHSY